jgi:hypothetical protein
MACVLCAGHALSNAHDFPLTWCNPWLGYFATFGWAIAAVQVARFGVK